MKRKVSRDSVTQFGFETSIVMIDPYLHSMTLARHWHYPGSMSVATIFENKNLNKKRMMSGRGSEA